MRRGRKEEAAQFFDTESLQTLRLMRRKQLTEAQIAALFDPPTDQRELVRYCTFSEANIVMIRRCRGDHSRLGYALMLWVVSHRMVYESCG